MSNEFNEKQLYAIESRHGKTIVMAGPGTGKTQIISGVIERLKKEDKVKDEEIQMITFTTSGVQAMKERIEKKIGKNNIPVNTFHSFALKVIKDNSKYFENRIGNPSSIKDVIINEDSLRRTKGIPFLKDSFETLFIINKIFEDNLDKLPEEILFLRGEKIKMLLGEISKLKNKNISVNEYIEYNDYIKKYNYENVLGEIKPTLKKYETAKEKIDKVHRRGLRIGFIYKEYENFLTKNKVIDFNDILLIVIEAFKKNKDLLKKYSDKIKYLIVDEYQDSNRTQDLLIDILGQENIFLVGDEKQSIFGFQGADIEIIKEREEDPEFKKIVLIDNYRSTQNILDFANEIYSRNIVGKEASFLGKKLHLNSNIEKNNPVAILKYDTRINEVTGIVTEINNMIKKGAKAKDISVICRKNKECELFVPELLKNKIPFNINIKPDIYEDELIAKIYVLIEYSFLSKFNNKYSNNKNFYYISSFFEKNQEIIDRFFYEEFKRKEFNIEEILKNKTSFNSIYKNILLGFEYFHTKLNGYFKLPSDFIQFFVDKIFDRLSFENSYEKEKNKDNILKLKELFLIIESKTENKNFEEFINEVLTKYRLAKTLQYDLGEIEISSDGEKKEEGVHLLTGHRSKGLEFDHVFLYKNNSSKKSPSYFPEITKQILNSFNGKGDLDSAEYKSEIFKEEISELNLYYVSLTRAKYNLILTYSSYNENGKPILAIEYLSDGNYLENKDKTKVVFFDRGSKKDISLGDKDEGKNFFKKEKHEGFYKDLSNGFLENRNISFSLLNKYYSGNVDIKEEYLLQLKDRRSMETVYGSIVHKILSSYIEKGFYIDKNLYLNIVEKGELHDSLLTNVEKNIVKERLIKFINELLPRDVMPLTNKIFVSEMGFNANIEGIKIEGYVDALEADTHSDKEKIFVKILDFKTGSYKTYSEIMKSSEYYAFGFIAQMFFYYILLNTLENKEKLRGILIDKGFIRDSDKREIKIDVGTFYFFTKQGLKLSDNFPFKEFAEPIDEIQNKIIELHKNFKEGIY